VAARAAARGAHFLVDRAVVDRLVGAAGLGPGDLVLDLGAGSGALTAPLAATGARVLAVERDPRLVANLRRRFAGCPGVRVVEGDLRTVPLPHRPYAVVANPPFAGTAALLARLLDDPRGALVRADLLVELGAARCLTGPPRGPREAWWTARYEAVLVRQVPAGAFRPVPQARVGQLALVRRPLPGGPRGPVVVQRLVAAAWRDRRRPARRGLAGLVPADALGRVWAEAALRRDALPAEVPPAVWCRLAGLARLG
jgi:23S rRNA (adenine-N6)-dimethyltransferase